MAAHARRDQVEEFVEELQALSRKLDDTILAYGDAHRDSVFTPAVILGATSRLLCSAILAGSDPADSYLRATMQILYEMRQHMHDPSTCPACLAGDDTDPTQH